MEAETYWIILQIISYFTAENGRGPEVSRHVGRLATLEHNGV